MRDAEFLIDSFGARLHVGARGAQRGGARIGVVCSVCVCEFWAMAAGVYVRVCVCAAALALVCI